MMVGIGVEIRSSMHLGVYRVYSLLHYTCRQGDYCGVRRHDVSISGA